MIIEWITKTGQHVPLGSMETRHILNCLHMIRQGRLRRPSCSGFTNAEWVHIFATELTRRTRRDHSKA